MFKKASLKAKLLLAFSFLSAFIIMVAGMSYFSMKKVQSEYGYIADVMTENIQKASAINDAGQEANYILFRSYTSFLSQDHESFERYRKNYADQSTRLSKLDKEYRSTPFGKGEEALYENVWQAWLKYQGHADEYMKRLNASFENKTTGDDAKELLDGNIRTSRHEMKTQLDKLSTYQMNEAHRRSEVATEVYSSTSVMSSIISLLGVIFALTIGLFFSQSISKTMTSISENILNSSTQTASGSQQLTSASSQLSQGATESAASLEETVSSLEELSSMVKLNSDHAKEANSLSQRSLSSAEQGEKEISKLISAMGDMSRSSKKIEEIINVIDDIAFQTNLLALNAAVEAARAGEQGKGFAVVADAVRNLAGRSAVAAKDINTLIKENVGKTEEGVVIADTSGASLKEILNSVKKVADLNSEIAAASHEQATGIEQITKAMNHLDQAIQSNASSSEEVASSAAEMSSQAECLSELVHDMKIFILGRDEEQKVVTHSPTFSKKAEPHTQLKIVSSARKAKYEAFPLDDDENPVGKAEGF